MERFQIIGCIVAYKSNREVLKRAADSFLKTKLHVKLFLIDNSPTDALHDLFTDPRVEYKFMGRNLGFGKAHNVAMRQSIELKAQYHVVLNPDIFFNPGLLETLYSYMESTPDVGQMMPKILYPDGDVQRLCKLLPTPIDLFLRRFFPWFPGAQKRNETYELLHSGYDRIMNIPYLSGCFMFLRNAALEQVGLFDERIFMYIEDADLTRRIHMQMKTIYYPECVVFHHYEKGSYKSFKLMTYNIHGALVYFTKWGWIFDRERKRINDRVKLLYLKNKDFDRENLHKNI